MASESIIQKLLNNGFSSLSYSEKKEVIDSGRPCPNLTISTCVKGKSVVRGFDRHFRKELYNISDWLCGCDVMNKFYCWICVLFSTKKNGVWNHQGYGDLNHLNTAVKKHREVTVLCLGPLTNVALAIRMDPTFSTKVKQLIIMGGSVKGIGNASPGVEFNFFIDPVADYIVFNSTDTSIEAIQPIVLVPWESVLRNTISTDWRINVLGSLSSPEIELLNKAEKYQLEADYPTWECADCLAGGVLVDPSLVLENGTYYAIAIYDGTITQGSLIVDYTDMENMSPNVVIVKTVDVERYKNLLLSGIGGSS